MTHTIKIAQLEAGPSHPLLIIAGPCVIESYDQCARIGEAVAAKCRDLALPYIFKASFDKANRSSIHSKRGPGLDAVVAVEVPREELVRRLSGRLVCRDCGAMYHALSNPPEHAARCDRCGGALYQREDDRPDQIVIRLDLHARELAPVQDYYRACGLLRAVEGTGTKDDVFGRIRASLP